MLRYVIKRILWLIPIILGVSFFIMLLMELCPGEPAAIILGVRATPEAIAELNAELGLDRPFFVRYADFIINAVTRFDLGESYITGDSIRDQLFLRIPYTLRLSVICILVATVVGITAGVIAATNQNSIKDNLTMFCSLFCVSMPEFWFALMMVSIFALKLNLLPSIGVDSWKGYVIPCIAMSLGQAAQIARQTRSSMLEVIRQDYITTARAKGQSERRVVFDHALKNALMPIITVVGSSFAGALGGSMVIESIFSIPGMGNYLISAINSRDYAVIQAGVFVTALWFSVCMLVIDLLYALIDPRIRAQYSRSKKRAKKAKEAASE